MPKFPVDSPRQLWRFFNGKMWTGYEFTESKEENRALAKFLRLSGIPAKSIILPETWGNNFGMQAPERYVVYIPVVALKEHKPAEALEKFYQERTNLKSEKDVYNPVIPT